MVREKIKKSDDFMGFRELNLKYYYNNEENNIVDDFYNPVLINAVKYRRATGYFSSSSFWTFVEGLRIFLEKNDSKIELLVSPNLSEEDIKAISLGEKAKEETIEGFIISKILEEDKYKDQFNLLAWLIYEEKLDLKIVVKKDFNKYGIFHDKFAILYDENYDKIAFHGSLNESETGIMENFESINIFNSWNESDKCRIEEMEKIFNKLWENKSNNWITYDFSESIKQKVIQKRDIRGIYKERKEINIPKKYVLRDYQEKAIQAWFGNTCKGILEMATGSGKTLTAIFAMTRLIKTLKSKGFPCGILIVVPYKNLLEQWCEELSEFNIYPIKCYENKELWFNKLSIEISNFNSNSDADLFIITTNKTFISKQFQSLLYKIKRDYIFCVDEMHHLLSPKISKLLPLNTDIRLGLTATLYNEFEEDILNRVKNYFGDIIYTFSLNDAIENNCLTRYYYYPIFVELTNEEMDEYIELTSKIAKQALIDEKSETLKVLLNQRRRIIFNAKNKIRVFSTMKSEIKKYKRTLIYCGDKIDDDGKFINKVNRIVYDMGITTHTYTSELSNKEREVVLDKFKKGEINVLTAIRCLDEGVNIPSLDCAFILSSNTDSKQFIQRRGRILRKAPNKEYAYIYDFMVIPSLDIETINNLDYETKRVQRKIILKELKRVYEFASLCENNVSVLLEVSKIIDLYK